MTEPALPKLNYPRVMLVVTENVAPIDPGQSDNRKTMTWAIGSAHPIIQTVNIVAMYVEDAVIAIYSVGTDEKGKRRGMRDLIPFHRAKFVSEGMPLDVFAHELAASEAGDEEEDEDDEEEEEDENEFPPVSGPIVEPSNGQPTSS